MDNRTIIAIVLVILLWSGYSLFFAPTYPVQETVVESVPDVVSDPVKSHSLSESATVNERDIVTVERIITVQTDLYTAEISTAGASIQSFKLHNYNEDNTDDSAPYYFINNDSPHLNTLKLSISDGALFSANILYNTADLPENTLIVSDKSAILTFYASSGNLLVTKEFTFHNESYHVDVNVNVKNISEDFLAGKLNLSLITPWSDQDKSDFYSFNGPLTFDGKKLHEDKPKNLSKSPKIYQDFTWSGFTNKYFFQAVYFPEDIDHVFITSSSDSIENRFVTDLFNLRPSEEKSFLFISYIGPKKLEYLTHPEVGFEEALHFGFFHFLSKPLFDVLRFFNTFLNNYGFSIILLTVCIKMIFWPLTHKSYKSMQGMQKLQPEMKRLKEKYSDDKQRLNQEMMAFYRENKINPLGGCLPILIQIPVFFALYKVLLDSIELRHAPFMLWITDLSAKDPYYITPIVMGASMFLQQKLTPTNMDPMQEKIMLMMPVIFTFMFLGFPSGLVLYWLVNNVLTIVQQLIIRRQAARS